MTDIHGQKGGEMLQYLEMSAVLPAGFSQLWSMGISIPLPRRLVLRALEAGECLSAFKKYRRSESKRNYVCAYDEQIRRKTFKGTWFFK